MKQIIQQLCRDSLPNNPNRNMKAIKYITIHCTGNRTPAANAKMHANYQCNGSAGNTTSWHYTVDKDSIYQSFDDWRECWHAGDGNGPGNTSSIGIEICVNDQYGFKAACDNAAWLTAELCKRHSLFIDSVVQHNRWSGKNCPAELRSGEWGVKWNDYIAMVAAYIKADSVPATVPQWQRDAFDRMVDRGLISTPDYWVPRLDKPITSGEVIGLLDKIYGQLKS